MKVKALSNKSEPGSLPGRGRNLTAPFWKRALDLTLILVSAPLTLAAAALIALQIRLSSRGPVVFRQERVGVRGQRFICLKFRTMHLNAGSTSHRDYLHQLIGSETPMTKLDLKGDSRLIPGGAFLRATGLDELPQLVNILRGEMSLVGPRPCLPYEAEKYSDWHLQRFETLPGLTGWWQVSGKNRTTFNEMMRMDIWYAQHKSLGLDLRIIARTPFALLTQLLEVRLANRGVSSPRVQKSTGNIL